MTAPTLARDASGAVRVPLRWVSDLDAVSVDLYHRLRTVRGTALDDVERGLPWWDWLARWPGPQVVQAVVRSQLLADASVVDVERVSVSVVDAAVSIVAVVRVRLDGRVLSTSVAVTDPLQTSGPPPLYLTGGLL